MFEASHSKVVSEKHFIEPLSQNLVGTVPESTCDGRTKTNTPKQLAGLDCQTVVEVFPDLASILDVGLLTVDNQSTMQPTLLLSHKVKTTTITADHLWR